MQNISRDRTPWRRRVQRLRGPVAIAATVGAVLLGVTGLGTGRSVAQPAASVVHPAAVTKTQVKPTIVFVHGAWADASGFDAEITALSALGFPVVAVANPLRGLTSDSDYVRARVQAITGPVVLVGHSYGGAVITNAARGTTNVKALVYLAAFSLAEGDSLDKVLPADTYPGSHLDGSKLDVVPVPNAAAPGGQDVDLSIKTADFADIFAGDVSKKEAALQAATQRPLANFAYTEKSGPPAWATIPSWDLITTQDHAISPAGQKFMAARMHAHTETVASAHDVMISHPLAVDRIILEAVVATS